MPYSDRSSFDRLARKIPVEFDCILPVLGAANLKQALQTVAGAAARALDRNEKLLLENLMRRERRAPSAVGGGVAIPHARMNGLDRPFLAFARFEGGVNFNAVDNVPVDLVCLVLSPENTGNTDHLRRLARVSRLFRDRGLCHRLRGAEEESAVRALMLETAEEAAQAA